MRAYTSKTPQKGRHFKLAPYVGTNVPGRQGWFGYALERHDDGTVSVVWTETMGDVKSSHKVVERISFEDIIWIEGLPEC